MSLERPHCAFPFRRDGSGKVVCVEQDEPEHISSCEQAIIACPVGWRDDRPDFGWPFPMFRNQPLNLDALTMALQTCEPRSDATAEAVYDDAQAAVRMMLGEADIEVQVPVQEESGG